MTTLDTAPVTATPHASWRNLGLSYLAACALLTVQSLGYHHWSHGDNSLASDIPTYLIGGLIGAAIAALGLVRVRRSRRQATTAARVGAVLAGLGVLVFPVAYYLPTTVIWGATGHLLGRDAESGRTAAAARVLGVVAVLFQVALVVARLCGVTYQVGG